ncbi:MAG: glucokinase [Rhizobiales bacterium]|nr:glucokinase [Hyphomicrobiales bacterium]
MAELALVGDIGGTNSRFGLVQPGSTAIRDITVLKNRNFGSLEQAIGHYVKSQGIGSLAAAAIAVAGPAQGEVVSLTNYDWSFTRESLRRTAKASRFRLLNDFEALALSLPSLAGSDVVQIGGETSPKPAVKIVLGPGTGLGMATLAPQLGGRWMVLPGEIGHTTLPVVTQEEFDWRQIMSRPGVAFEAEHAVTGGGLLQMYRAIAPLGPLTTPETIGQAALAGTDAAAVRTVEQFIVWLARIAGDAAMTLQAHGGVYLAGDIAASLTPMLQTGPFRTIFQGKGPLAHILRPIPVYVIVDRHAALKGCASAIAE